MKRALQKPGETLPWQPARQQFVQPHDEATPEVERSNYFSPSRVYCVETICAPCRVVIAWTILQNYQLIFCNSYILFIQLQILDLTIFALTRPV